MILNDNQLCMNLHHTANWVADVDEAMQRYSILLGLHGERVGESAIMRCMHEDFCVVMRTAEARRIASTMTSSSMRFSADGGQVG